MPQKGSTHSSNIRVGQETGVPATRTVGSVVLHQRAEGLSAATSGVRVFVLPSSAEITYFDVALLSSIPGEATVRFGAVGAGGSDFYGRVTISAAGVYTISSPGTSPTVWAIGASSQPIGYAMVSGSGQISPFNNNAVVKVFYTRKYEKFDT